MKRLIAFLALSTAALAQPVIAPTNEPVGPRRGEDFGGYNVTQSYEFGYRWHTVGGNEGKYRSDVNFGNGLRLLGGNITVHSKEGLGTYFDELVLSTQGLGNDPYQFANLRISKNRFYRYDLLWRENQYYNPGFYIANGQHFMDTSRKMQDHSLTFFPQSSFKFFNGYSRNTQSGPALTTINLFDITGDQFPLFSNVRRSQHEYRIGAEFGAFGTKLSFLRTWEFFKDDTEESGTPLPGGNNPDDRLALSSFRRAQPYHGRTASWLVNLISDRSDLYQINGRFAYAGGRRNFLFDETALGTNRFGSAQNRQSTVFGRARRPVTAANLTLSLFPNEKITISNHTAFHHTRMDGDGVYREVNNGNFFDALVQFQFLGIRTITNITDANIRPTSWIGFRTGYQYSSRRVRSIEQETFAGVPDRLQGEQTNKLHAGLFGVRLRPVKPFSINLDAEIGRADRPIYPTSERNYHALSGRAQYRGRQVTVGVLARTNYNFNSVSLFSHSSKTRTYGADASWSPREWFGFDAAYSKLHLDTLSGVAYFVTGQLLNDRARYRSEIHSGTLTARFTIRRVDLFAGYSRVEDNAPPSEVNPGSAPGGIFTRIVAYPLAFESPMARVSLRLHEKLRFNVGYQHYRYREDISTLLNYRAHTGFTSLTWSF